MQRPPTRTPYAASSSTPSSTGSWSSSPSASPDCSAVSSTAKSWSRATRRSWRATCPSWSSAGRCWWAWRGGRAVGWPRMLPSHARWAGRCAPRPRRSRPCSLPRPPCRRSSARWSASRDGRGPHWPARWCGARSGGSSGGSTSSTHLVSTPGCTCSSDRRSGWCWPPPASARSSPGRCACCSDWTATKSSPAAGTRCCAGQSPSWSVRRSGGCTGCAPRHGGIATPGGWPTCCWPGPEEAWSRRSSRGAR